MIHTVIFSDKNYWSYAVFLTISFSSLSFFLCYRDFTNSYEPFVVPEYLQGELEEFEALCDISNSNSYQRLLGNNQHQTCESLYEYVYISVLSSLKALILLHNFYNIVLYPGDPVYVSMCRKVCTDALLHDFSKMWTTKNTTEKFYAWLEHHLPNDCSSVALEVLHF